MRSEDYQVDGMMMDTGGPETGLERGTEKPRDSLWRRIRAFRVTLNAFWLGMLTTVLLMCVLVIAGLSIKLLSKGKPGTPLQVLNDMAVGSQKDDALAALSDKQARGPSPRRKPMQPSSYKDQQSKRQLHCTMATCFQRSKCGLDSNDFRFYLHERPADYDRMAMYGLEFPSYNKERAAELWDSMYEAFSKHPQRTHDVGQACVFVPYFDTTASATVTNADSLRKIELALQSLSTWNGHGRNHLVFDRHEDDACPYGLGEAINVRASLSFEHYRPGFDLTWIFRPEYFSCPFARNETLALAFRQLPVVDRPRRAFFRGIYSHPLRPLLVQHYATRRDSMHENEHESFSGESQGSVSSPLQEHDGTWQAKALQPAIDMLLQQSDASYTDYCELFPTALFGLNPRGKGLLTYRTLEIMQIGAVHVYLGDRYRLPYDEILDWSRFSIRVPEVYSTRLDWFLRRYSPQQLQSLQDVANEVYDKYFVSFEKELPLFLAHLKARIYNEPQLVTSLNCTAVRLIPTD